jgi:hypothetical protein
MEWMPCLVPFFLTHTNMHTYTMKTFYFLSFNVQGLDHLLVSQTSRLLYQYEENGTVADSMLVNTTLMLVYVTKFFWWEAGYWNTMDIAHDRGINMLYCLCFTCYFFLYFVDIQ